MAYIDREKLRDSTSTWLDGNVLVMPVSAVDEAPTADVVEVVRCKDCKYYHKDICYCDILLCNMKKYDYCSYGDTE